MNYQERLLEVDLVGKSVDGRRQVFGSSGRNLDDHYCLTCNAVTGEILWEEHFRGLNPEGRTGWLRQSWAMTWGPIIPLWGRVRMKRTMRYREAVEAVRSDGE